MRDLGLFAEAIRNIAVFYDGVVVPGAIILFVSGTWMTADVFDTPFLPSRWSAHSGM